MRVDVSKIDDRIRRLQEIRRIAADPEMMAILIDFLVEDQAPARSLDAGTASAPNNSPEVNEAGRLINEMLGQGEAPAPAAGGTGGLWGRRTR